jgi:hypothetical protein
MFPFECELDNVTFDGLLFAYSHTDLADAGQAHFRTMQAVHHITPWPDH